MKIAFIISIIHLVIGCTNSDKSNTVGNSNKPTAKTIFTGKDTLNLLDSSIEKSNDEIITITVSYAAIECGCPQWFETKFKDIKFLDGVKRFYLEPTSKSLINANNLWDGEHLPLTIKITGSFSKEKEMPVTYHAKGNTEKARIFWYNKITIVSPSSNKKE